MRHRTNWIGCLLALTLTLAATAAEPCSCPEDIDGDDVIGFDDLLLVLSSWGPCAPCDADVTQDGMVGFADLLAVLSGWGPCVFDYGPPRDNAEAEQIGLEMLGGGGPLLLPTDIYDRIDRDLALIREAVPSLAGQPHTQAWLPNQLIVKKIPSAPAGDYDALNACLQLTLEDPLFGDWYVLTFSGNLNVVALAATYQALDHIEFAEPNGLIGGQNFYTPSVQDAGTWRWNIDDGFHDCFDGCDCHRLHVIDVTADGVVNVISYQEVGQPWCEF